MITAQSNLARSRSSNLQLLASAAVFIPLFAATYYGAYLLRFAGDNHVPYVEILLGSLLWVLVVKWVVFLWFRVHQGWTRYVSFHDLLVLGKAVTASAVGVTLVDALCLPRLQIPRSVVLIDWGMTLGRRRCGAGIAATDARRRLAAVSHHRAACRR